MHRHAFTLTVVDILIHWSYIRFDCSPLYYLKQRWFHQVVQVFVFLAYDVYAYQRALQVYPWAPAVRLGIALCHYKLGRFGKAKQAFHRVLQASGCLSCGHSSTKLIHLQLQIFLDLDVDLAL